MFWTHLYGTSDDDVNHVALSTSGGKEWTKPAPTNLQGQVCAPIPLADGSLAAIYNFRNGPPEEHGVHVALCANDPSYRRFHAWCTRLHNATVRRIEAPLEQDLLPEPLPRDLATP